MMEGISFLSLVSVYLDRLTAEGREKQNPAGTAGAQLA